MAVTGVAWGTFSLVVIAALALLVRMSLRLWRGAKGLLGALSAFGEAIDSALGPVRDDLERIDDGLSRIGVRERRSQ